MPMKIITSLWAELNATLFANNIDNFTSVVNSGVNRIDLYLGTLLTKYKHHCFPKGSRRVKSKIGFLIFE